MMQDGKGGVQPLDLMLFATPEKIFGMIERYGEFTRSFYRNVELTVDIIYPIIYLFFFGLLISWLFQRGFAPGSSMRKYNIMPLGAWFFDLIENIVSACMDPHSAKHGQMVFCRRKHFTDPHRAHHGNQERLQNTKIIKEPSR
jgi:hypothetical protein